MQKGGANNLKEMPFFSNIRWPDMAKQILEPPFMPKPFDIEALKNKEDTMEILFDELEEWDGGLHEENWHDYKGTKRNAQIFTNEDQARMAEELQQQRRGSQESMSELRRGSQDSMASPRRGSQESISAP